MPDIGCSVMKANFYLSQALTGHGAFGYLKRIGKLSDDKCQCDIEIGSRWLTCSRNAQGIRKDNQRPESGQKRSLGTLSRQ